MAFSASSAPMIRTPSVDSPGCLSRGNISSSMAVASLDLQQLVLFVLERLVDLAFVGVGELVQLLFGAGDLVLGRLTIFHQSVELVSRAPAQVADRDLALLSEVPDPLDQFLAPLLGQLREHQADHDPVVGRVETEVRVADRLFDRGQSALVVRAHDQQTRLWNAEAGELLKGGLDPVGLDRKLLDERGGGSTGPHVCELRPRVLDSFAHLLVGLRDDEIEQLTHWTSVPIASPSRMDRTLPRVIRSNTTIGRSFSMQSVTAVGSIARSPWLMTSM